MTLFENIAIPVIAVMSAMLFFYILKSCGTDEPQDEGPKLKAHQIYAIVMNPSGSLRLGKTGLSVGLAVVGPDTMTSAAMNNSPAPGAVDERAGSQEDQGGGSAAGVVEAEEERDAQASVESSGPRLDPADPVDPAEMA